MEIAEAESGTFVYANPRTIHWGAGTVESHLEAELSQRRLDRAFLITTRSVAGNPALGSRLREILGSRLVGEFGAISQHAPAEAVAAAADAARAARPDVLISFGGGSPIDAGKSVGFALATGLELRDPRAADHARALRPAPDELLPHLAIPTTLSAAELSGLAGFTTETDREKVGLRGEALIPTAVVFDAELSLHTPVDLWLSTGIRAVDHAVETLLAPRSHPFSDTLALEALRRLQSSLLATRADPNDLAARTESQLGAWFSFTLPGPAAGGLSHTLGKRIGSRHGIPHGVSSCLLLPHVMRYLADRDPKPLARAATALGVDTAEMPTDLAARRAADAVADLIRALDLPRHLAEYGLSQADLEAAARPMASEAYPFEDLVGIYRAAE
ncbi:MAG: iron-containing alcohol dehydrogenase [Chloroflexi bacterium]|nr:iron-containing alcohol dehydrogenase [Chloroflexota bacterium]MBV9598946.1 iron-containing alcohol dehydrogenase [Chloroflexota bacterium]